MATSSDAGAFARLRAAVAARVQAIAAARLRLHENWRELLRNAWSVRFALIAAVSDGVAMLCGFFTDAPEAVRPWFAAAGMASTILAAVARLMPQSNVNNGGA